MLCTAVFLYEVCLGITDTTGARAGTGEACDIAAQLRRWGGGGYRHSGRSGTRWPAIWRVRRFAGCGSGPTHASSLTGPAHAEVMGLLRNAVTDLASRLGGNARQMFTSAGSPDVKQERGRHLCRHRWRLRLGVRELTLSLCAHK